jgi:8-oxo-dGTP pyrophosphatase MutT (NUDIX family)
LRELTALFDEYARRWPDEAEIAARFVAFISSHPDCLERTCVPGHLTGAALVTDPALDRVLLTHHRKLDKWLQLGGHADGEAILWKVAAKEAEEESGLRALAFCSDPRLRDARGVPLPFDLDIHDIPARKSEPAHLHYDVRFVVVARDEHEAVVISDESHDVRWFSLVQARALTDEPSMTRQFDKLEMLRASALRP